MAPRRVVTLLSIALHAIAIVCLVVANLRAVGPLPEIHRPLTFENVRTVQIKDIDLPPPPRAEAATTSARSAASPSAAPVVAPSVIRPETGLERVRESNARTDVVDVESGGGSGLDALSGHSAPPPPPAATPQRPVPLHSGMQAPRKIVDVAPAYPAIARAAHVEGVVILEAVIDVKGGVASVRVLRSIPLLDQAAVDAVRQWRFTPTLLSGVPVPIVMTVTVNFALTR